MKSIVEQYARGEFDVERPEVDISVSRLELNIESGTVYAGEFVVRTLNDIPIKFMVYDSHYIFDFNSHTFVGKKNKVKYSFDATGLERGKVYKGNINIITDGGEFRLPYTIEIIAPYIEVAEDKKLFDLFQFAQYAENDWESAIKIFDSENFVRTFMNDDEKAKRVYESLNLSLSINQAMEEFLVYTHKKRALTLSVSAREVNVEMPDEVVRASITINKNTWGYTHTRISSDCDFLIPEKTRIKACDFIGNNCQLDFLIDPNRIPEGVNAGYINISNTYQVINVKVGIVKPVQIKANPKTSHDRYIFKKNQEKLIESYLDFRTDKISLDEYTQASMDALNVLLSYKPEDGMYRLGSLHMHILNGDKELVGQEFVRIDADAENSETGEMEKCYYSYLKALYTRDRELTAAAAEKIRFEFEKGENKLFYFWLLLFVDERFAEDKWLLYEDIQKLYDEGVNSPVIYFEICDMFNKQPLMMKRIAPLEVSAIRWGVRHEFVSEDVIVEFVKTASRMKNFETNPFRLLEQLYDLKKDVQILSVICSILIRNSKHDEIYHRYYEAAVEADLKFVGLYECFIKSMNKSRYDEIPEAILRYFNYKNTLNEDELAYLYANVVFNKDRHRNVYQDYIPAIESFMEKMIVRGRVNDDLTVIYDEFLDPETVSSEFASKLINIIFKRKFVCKNKNITSIIVTHQELSQEITLPVVNGEAYVEIISPSAVITMLDARGGRYVGTIPFRLERIVDEKAYLDICRKYNPKDYRLLLYDYNLIGTFTYKDAREVNLARDITACPDLSYAVKQRALMHIIEYYHENYDSEILVKYLSKLDLEYVSPADAGRITNYYIAMRMHDSAFSAIHKFGFMDADVDYLIKLAEYGIGDKKYIGDRSLLAICVYLNSRGYADEKILEYLINNYNGTLDDMAQLFKSVDAGYRNIDLLSENILAQMMFADAYTDSIYDVFEVYYKGRSRGMVIKGFLRYCAYRYLIKDIKIPAFVMECLYNEIIKQNITDEISRMALLYYFSSKGRYTSEQVNWISTNVKHFIDCGKTLPFFKEFATFVNIPANMVFNTYLIFKGESGRQVWVSYSFGQESASMAQYKSERMNEIIAGIYVKELVVFHGESLIYSIDSEVNGTSEIVESNILKDTNYHKKNSNRFELINSMLVSQETRNDQDLIQAMDTYLNNTHFFEENLKIL